MLNERPTTPLVVRIATPQDIPQVERLDSFSTSPTRHIHRAMEKYFGPIDPSTHEHIVIFLAEVAGVAAAKAELMLPSQHEFRNTGVSTGATRRNTPSCSQCRIHQTCRRPSRLSQTWSRTHTHAAHYHLCPYRAYT